MPKEKEILLSKSKFIEGLQCPKLLWYEYNRKKDIPPPSPQMEEIFKQGRVVGELARALFPGGLRIKWDRDPYKLEDISLKAIKENKPLFEAGFIHDSAYALADVLLPSEDDFWDIIEVKSTTGVKENHYYDLAFQKHVYEGSGLKIGKCYLMYLNRDYIRRGEIDLEELFVKKDLSEKVDELLPAIDEEIRSMLEVIKGKEPEVKVGEQCTNDCFLNELCFAFLPENSVFLLRGKNKTAVELMEKGILKLQDVPDDYELSAKHLIQVKSHNLNEPHVDKEKLKEFIDKLKYPLYFLDFETIAPAIPIYDLSSPYEDIPFQFSLHVIEKKGVKPAHYSLLADGGVDPRPEVLKKLKELLGSSGSIIAYFADFEMRCIKNAVKAYPEYKPWMEKLMRRFVDLFVPFKDFYYYNPAQQGSASIKDVLPALTGISYKGMEIADGWAARNQYMKITFEKDIQEDEKKAVREALEKYCSLDTQGMIEILFALQKQL